MVGYLTLQLILSVSPLVASGQGDTQLYRELTFRVYAYKKLRGIYFDTYSIKSSHKNKHLTIEPIPLRFYTVTRSPYYQYLGSDPIIFYRYEIDPLDSVKKIKKQVGSIAVPPTMKSPLFVFIRNAESGKNYSEFKINVFDDSALNLPNNSMVVYNLSGHLLEGLMGPEKVKLKIGPSLPLSVRNKLPVTLWYKINGKMVPGFNLPLNFERSHRYLLFFFPPALDGAIELQYRLLDEEVETPQILIMDN